MRFLRTALLLPLVLLLTLSFTGSAFAADAELKRDIYLTKTPPVGASATISRTIYIAADTYRWGVLLGGGPPGSAATRNIYLASGNYTWTCKIAQLSGYRYFHRCTLSQPGYATAVLQTPGFTLSDSKVYPWVSGLDRVHA